MYPYSNGFTTLHRFLLFNLTKLTHLNSHFKYSKTKSLRMKRKEVSFMIALLFSDASSDWLITFASSLGPDQDRPNVGPDMDSKRLTL